MLLIGSWMIIHDQNELLSKLKTLMPVTHVANVLTLNITYNLTQTHKVDTLFERVRIQSAHFTTNL